MTEESKEETVTAEEKPKRKRKKTMGYSTCREGLQLIMHFEGLRLEAYQCAGGVWTIGYGHTAGVKKGDTCTVAEADEWLIEDVEGKEEAVRRLVRVEITQEQFSALVSFCFNVGSRALQTSTLLKKLNAEDHLGAADEFLRWRFAAGKVLPGLLKRREAERKLFVRGLTTE